MFGLLKRWPWMNWQVTATRLYTGIWNIDAVCCQECICALIPENCCIPEYETLILYVAKSVYMPRYQRIVCWLFSWCIVDLGLPGIKAKANAMLWTPHCRDMRKIWRNDKWVVSILGSGRTINLWILWVIIFGSLKTRLQQLGDCKMYSSWINWDKINHDMVYQSYDSTAFDVSIPGSWEFGLKQEYHVISLWVCRGNIVIKISL